MGLLSTLSTDAAIADETDSLGSGSVFDSGLYKCSIDLAYINKVESGALGLVVHLKTENKRELRQTLWMTSGTAKGGKNYYEKDGEKIYLPGFLQANALSLLTIGKEISSLDTETKVVKLYSPQEKKEVPTKVEVLVDLLNQEILVGVIKQKVSKTKKNAATGEYEATDETRDENDIDKLFRARDRMTTAEIRAQETEAKFCDSWEKRWTGITKDRTKASRDAKAAPGAPAATKKPATSLFG